MKINYYIYFNANLCIIILTFETLKGLLQILCGFIYDLSNINPTTWIQCFFWWISFQKWKKNFFFGIFNFQIQKLFLRNHQILNEGPIGSKQYKRMLKCLNDFTFFCFSKWFFLNLLMDDHHLCYIVKNWKKY